MTDLMDNYMSECGMPEGYGSWKGAKERTSSIETNRCDLRSIMCTRVRGATQL